jgi:hypothetical protein
LGAFRGRLLGYMCARPRLQNSTNTNMKTSRRFSFAKSKFRALTKYLCEQEGGPAWKLTASGNEALQLHAETALLRLLEIVVESAPKKTVSDADVRRADRFVGLLLGVQPAPGATPPPTIVFPKKLFERWLRAKYGKRLRVSRVGFARVSVLYTSVVRFLLGALSSEPLLGCSGKQKTQFGADDVGERLDGFAFTTPRTATPGTGDSSPV